MAKCGACGKFIKGGVVCPLCFSQSHNECVRIPAGTKIADTWRCGDCQTKVPKGRDPRTTVSDAQDNLTARAAQTPKGAEFLALDDTAHNITAEFSEMELQLEMRSMREDIATDIFKVQQTILSDLKAFKAEFGTLCQEMREFRVEMADFRVCVAGISARMDGFEQRLEAVERQRAEPAAPEGVVADLERTVEQLKVELNDRDQDALLSDLEIGHLPEEKGESVLHAVTVLAAKLGVVLEERDVVFAERVGVPQLAAGAGQAPRARRVVVRLARRHLRDQLLQAARVRRTLTAADAGAAPPAAASAVPTGRIFLNERLTRINRTLFHRVREECRRLQWRYSWTKRGRVFARQSDGKQAHSFRTEADLVRVFGSSSV